MRTILPTASMYAQSITNSFGLTRTLPEIVPCLDYDHQPISFCGAWAVVFKVKFLDPELYGDKEYALKCYLKKGNNPEVNARFLAGIDSKYVVGFEYLDNELYVYDQNGGASYFPVCVMEWVGGETLAHAIKRFCRPINRRGDFDAGYMSALRRLSAKFDVFALWLLGQPFAHADLKSDNILIDEDLNIRVIDYDNIYIPEAEACSKMVFSPEFAHPSRTAESRGLWLDDYPLTLISLSLHVLIDSPELYSKLHDGENIIFTPSEICRYGSPQYQILDSLRAKSEAENRHTLASMIDALRGESAKIECVDQNFHALRKINTTFVESTNCRL